jgi:hypothetical protein
MPIKVRSRERFFTSPGPGSIVSGVSFYTRARGVEKMRVKHLLTKSDLIDATERSFSADNGQSWSDPERVPTAWDTTEGKVRRFLFSGFVDPENDRLLTIVLEGVLPTDNPSEGSCAYFLRRHPHRQKRHHDRRSVLPDD